MRTPEKIAQIYLCLHINGLTYCEEQELYNIAEFIIQAKIHRGSIGKVVFVWIIAGKSVKDINSSKKT